MKMASDSKDGKTLSALKLQREILIDLSESHFLSDAAPKFLKTLTEKLGWNLGLLWIRGEENTLRFYDSCGDGNYDEFLSRSKVKKLHQGEGIAGAIWQNRCCHWSEDISQEEKYLRREFAIKLGFKSAFWIPVYLGSESYGVLEFLSLETKKRDLAQIEMAEAIGLQIALFIQKETSDRQLSLHSKVLTSMTEGVSLTDEKGIIQYTNPSQDKIFGYEKGELIGKHVSILNCYSAEENERFVASVFRRLKESNSWEGEIDNKRKDGTHIKTFARITATEFLGKTYFVSVQEDITESLKQKRALAASESLFRNIYGANVIGLVFSSFKGGIVEANDTFLEMIGYNREELELGKIKWKDITHPDFHEVDRLAIEQIKKTGISTPYEKVYLRKDGQHVPVIIGSRRLMGHEKYDAVTFVLDNRTRKQAEVARDTSERRFRTFFEQATLPMMMFDKNGDVIQANLAWGKLFEAQVSDLVGYNILNDPQLREYGLSDEIAKVFKGEPVHLKPFYYDPAKIGRAGRARWLEINLYPIKLPNGEVAEIALFEQDVTELVKALQAMKEDEQKSRFLAHASTILNESLDYEKTLANLSHLVVPELGDWCTIQMVQPDKSIKQISVAHVDPGMVKWAWELTKKYPTDPSATNGVAKVLRTGLPEFVPHVSDEIVAAAAKDKEHLDLLRRVGFRSYLCVPIKMSHAVLGALSVIRTEETQKLFTESDLNLFMRVAEQAAFAVENARLYQQLASANRMKDEFLATLSHELRTPLNVIQGHSEILMSDLDKMSQDQILSSIEAIERNAKNQTQIISDLLDVSRIVTGKMSFHPVNSDLKAVLRAAVQSAEPLAREKNLILRVDIDSAPSSAIIDSTRIQQVVWNLLSNAIKFTDAGGTVILRCHRVDGVVQIEVQDTGLGMEPAFIPYVFDRFRQEDSSTTRKFGGLGIGLSIVRHLVELHKGFVKAESAGKGQGSKFTVYLPVDQGHSVTDVVVTPKAAFSPTNLNGLNILLVDDSTDNRKIVSLMLNKLGANVTEADSAKSARQRLKDTYPDLILSDIGMPEEDGIEFIKKLRQEEANSNKNRVPAIALTAYVRAEEQDMALQAGFNCHVGKPVSRQNLLSAIEKIMKTYRKLN